MRPDDPRRWHPTVDVAHVRVLLRSLSAICDGVAEGLEPVTPPSHHGGAYGVKLGKRPVPTALGPVGVAGFRVRSRGPGAPLPSPSA